MLLLLLEAEVKEGACKIGTRPVYVPDDPREQLESFRKYLDCEYVDYVMDHEIDGTRYDLIVDDEGLLKYKPPTYYINDEYVLFGNILFAHAKDGITAGLSEYEMKKLQQHVVKNVRQLSKRIERAKKNLAERRA